VDAVIIATPNVSHHPIAMAAIARGLHVLCEKPLAVSLAQAIEMAQAADAAGIRHMTAFTYRFVPAMRYMQHLVSGGFIGQPWHFRAQRFMDWGRQALGWRQDAALAGSGQVGDMLSHRIDYGHMLIGPIHEVTAHISRVWDMRVDAEGREHPSDLEDWVGCLARFTSRCWWRTRRAGPASAG
jgi:predicted dehydrogenase